MTWKEVSDFAAAMEEVLEENDHKTGWENLAGDDLLRRLYGEAHELSEAIAAEDDIGIRQECCDVANYAMMLFNNSMPPPPDVKPTESP